MFCYYWILLGVVSLLSAVSRSQQTSPLCESARERFAAEWPNTDIPEFCTQLQLRFNSTTYRINFTESEVNSACGSDICQAAMTDLVLPCLTFPKKDINCLDSPGLIRVWCSNSSVNSNTNCFTSLSNQGIIGTPNLFTPCLDAIYNAESCPAYCRNILMNADCCFVSYYTFIIDAFVGNSGFPIFEPMNFVNRGVWSWCDVTSPGICPGLNLTDYSPRDNNATCEFQPINITTISIPEPTPSVVAPPAVTAVLSRVTTVVQTMSPMPSNPTPIDSSGGIIIQEPQIGFNILLAFTLMTAFVSIY